MSKAIVTVTGTLLVLTAVICAAERVQQKRPLARQQQAAFGGYPAAGVTPEIPFDLPTATQWPDELSAEAMIDQQPANSLRGHPESGQEEADVVYGPPVTEAQQPDELYGPPTTLKEEEPRSSIAISTSLDANNVAGLEQIRQSVKGPSSARLMKASGS